MKSVSKILGFTTLFFVLCHCAQEHTLADELISQISLAREIGSDSAKINLNYHAKPIGGFTVDKVSVGDVELNDTPRTAMHHPGCGGDVFRVDTTFTQTIALYHNETSVTIATTWTGGSQQSFSENYVLPESFVVASTSPEISPSQPLSITFEKEVTRQSWDVCYLQYENKRTFAFEIFSPNAKQVAMRSVDIILDELDKKFHLGTASEFSMRLTCHKEMGLQNGSRLDYNLTSKPFTVKIAR